MGAVPGGLVRVDGQWRWVMGFLLDVRPVTNAEWDAFVWATGAPRPPWLRRPGFDDPQQPVVGITLAHARAFCRWARKRLPTEAEWLRAARGPSHDAPFPWGTDDPDEGRVHYRRTVRRGPASVGSLSMSTRGAGPYGHVDLLGNVWEWCANGALRGGFWGSESVHLEDRLTEPADRISAGIGFRCAR